MSQLIVIEALDAGGSETQTRLLIERLKKTGQDATHIHFPQEDRATGQFIYNKFLLAKTAASFSAREQALLFIQDFFSRLEDIEAMIKNQVLVLDRYYTSTMAYQTIGMTGQNRKERLQWLRHLCCEGSPALPKPNAIFFIDTPVPVVRERLRLQQKHKDFFEKKQKLIAIRKSYLKLAEEEHWIIIPGADQSGDSRSREEIHQEIWKTLTLLLKGEVK